MRALFPAVRDAVAKVIDPTTVRWVSFSHFEADECGSLNEWLTLAPGAQAAHCSLVGSVVSVDDFALRPARQLADDEAFTTGRRRFRFLHTPHVPHCWEAGMLFEETERTLVAPTCCNRTASGRPSAVPSCWACAASPSSTIRRARSRTTCRTRVTPGRPWNGSLRSNLAPSRRCTGPCSRATARACSAISGVSSPRFWARRLSAATRRPRIAGSGRRRRGRGARAPPPAAAALLRSVSGRGRSSVRRGRLRARVRRLVRGLRGAATRGATRRAAIARATATPVAVLAMVARRVLHVVRQHAVVREVVRQLEADVRSMASSPST